MYSTAVILQVIATLGCLASVVMMTFRKPSSYSNIIIITFICGFVQSGGYILELLSKNVDEGMMAVRAEYLGGAFEVCLITFFIFKYCGHEFNRLLKVILVLEGLVVLFGVWTWEKTHIYYTAASFVSDAVIPHLVLEHGFLYYLYEVTTVVELVACLFMLVVSVLKTRQEHMKYNYLVLIVIVIVPLVGFSLSVSGALEGYDATPISAAFSICIFALAIARDHVFDVADAASEKILSNLENAIIIINSENGYEYSNNRAKELFPVLNGYSRGNIIKDVEIQNLFDTDRSGQIKIDGHTFDVGINTVKEKDYEVGTAVILFDITESEHQIEQMQKLKEMAEDANRTKMRFLSSISYEIRTPINVIMGLSEVLIRDHGTSENLVYLHNIRSSSSTLLNLINDMLDYSKIEDGKLEFYPISFDLKKLFSEIITIFIFRSTQKGIDFKYDIEENIPRNVEGDELRIRQILGTLLFNSVKYTEHGFVSLKVTHKIRGNEDMDLIIVVEDTGRGIPPKSYGKIYEGVPKAGKNQGGEVDSVGLGLNISKQLVELMGGVINFKSEVGKGTVFSIIIPLVIESNYKIGEINTNQFFRAAYTAPDAKILIVEDSKVNLMVAEGLLKSIKSKVTTVDSGEKCLEITARERFDVILMDHKMPGMDGLETFTRLRASDSMCSNTPVIMYTAVATAESRAFYINKGFNDFLTKPSTEEQLITMLYKHLPEELIVADK